MATQQLPDLLRQLDLHGTVAADGRPSEPFRRWVGRRRATLLVAVLIAVAGVVGIVIGLVLREVGVWAILLPVGGFLVFAGLIIAGVLALVSSAHGFRREAETAPVVLDPAGVWLRGIGPLLWSDLFPPEYRRIVTKNDVNGRCAVMPLTPQGHARINAHVTAQALLVGPRPYLRADVPYLLLPGIDGLSEDETVRLFHTAYERYGPR
ncbi:hypothetical protein JL108_18095 [Aeromicrobium sp. YIM 150415]|uniref:hypothetical protein n=1 Tax=Aeromicrobium sp. YIM 150415 TaxID=2803912 RepID=UPI00196619AC|nr:hypothetical protein [Aeromicrobium sp. YIM 150415]MBM9465366.1 hypothetical protein [Aeromicrobium sp. YIM 150415]